MTISEDSRPMTEEEANLPKTENPEPEGVTEELPGDTYAEQLLRAVIQAYQEAYNKHNPKYEIKYYLTITNHKLATKEGNKEGFIRICAPVFGGERFLL